MANVCCHVLLAVQSTMLHGGASTLQGWVHTVGPYFVVLSLHIAGHMQIGTACVTRGQDSRLALGRLGGLVEQLETLVRSGKQVILVTSGTHSLLYRLCCLVQQDSAAAAAAQAHPISGADAVDTTPNPNLVLERSNSTCYTYRGSTGSLSVVQSSADAHTHKMKSSARIRLYLLMVTLPSKPDPSLGCVIGWSSA